MNPAKKAGFIFYLLRYFRLKFERFSTKVTGILFSMETISEIIKNANALAVEIETVSLLKEAFEIWEVLDDSVSENQCPGCREYLLKKNDVYLGHENWCFYKRIQNVLISKKVKVPDFCWR